ncbi:MAG: SET domain-containing protein [Bacteroidales bacterium]
MIFDRIDIHEMLLHQVGNSSEISDYRNDSVIISTSVIIPNEKGLIAIDTIPENTIIFSYKDKASGQRTKNSIQVGCDKHLEIGDFGIYANHACKPNSYMWTSYKSNDGYGHVVLISTESIAKGEEITFDYATTETHLTPEHTNKQCLCKTSECRSVLKGFFDLTSEEQDRLIQKGCIAPHLNYSKTTH